MRTAAGSIIPTSAPAHPDSPGDPVQPTTTRVQQPAETTPLPVTSPTPGPRAWARSARVAVRAASDVAALLFAGLGLLALGSPRPWPARVIVLPRVSHRTPGCAVVRPGAAVPGVRTRAGGGTAPVLADHGHGIPGHGVADLSAEARELPGHAGAGSEPGVGAAAACDDAAGDEALGAVGGPGNRGGGRRRL
jgi:hypothetical protein